MSIEIVVDQACNFRTFFYELYSIKMLYKAGALIHFSDGGGGGKSKGEKIENCVCLVVFLCKI